MKKLKKISLDLNKEVISNLSNNNLNELKGGSMIGTIAPVCPVQTVNAGTICPATDTCPIVKSIDIACIYTEQNTCDTTVAPLTKPIAACLTI